MSTAPGNTTRGEANFHLGPNSVQCVYKSDNPYTPSVHVTFFADDTCLYATERNEGYVPRNV
jgi:hypothetical protein